MNQKPLIINDGITSHTIYYEDCIKGMKNKIKDESIDMILTSPPYWNLKDYGMKNQIGFSQTLNDFRDSMKECFIQCFRVLKEARRMIINIADKTVASQIKGNSNLRGNFELIPLHSYVLIDALSVGFKYVGYILWYKLGGGSAQNTPALNFVGSYPYPPNAHVSLKTEFLLLFRKKESLTSRPLSRSKEIKEKSRVTKEQWKNYTNQIWKIRGEHVDGHPAVFPLEIAHRCISLWSFVEDIILDPFTGTGSSQAAAKRLLRNSIGFELNPFFKNLQLKRIGTFKNVLSFCKNENNKNTS